MVAGERLAEDEHKIGFGGGDGCCLGLAACGGEFAGETQCLCRVAQTVEHARQGSVGRYVSAVGSGRTDSCHPHIQIYGYARDRGADGDAAAPACADMRVGEPGKHPCRIYISRGSACVQRYGERPEIAFTESGGLIGAGVHDEFGRMVEDDLPESGDHEDVGGCQQCVESRHDPQRGCAERFPHPAEQMHGERFGRGKQSRQAHDAQHPEQRGVLPQDKAVADQVENQQQPEYAAAMARVGSAVHPARMAETRVDDAVGEIARRGASAGSVIRVARVSVLSATCT